MEEKSHEMYEFLKYLHYPSVFNRDLGNSDWKSKSLEFSEQRCRHWFLSIIIFPTFFKLFSLSFPPKFFSFAVDYFRAPKVTDVSPS